MYRIAINGFGRIGRNIVRALYERPELREKIQIVAINDLGSLEISAHLLQFDTVHGRFNQQVEVTDNAIVINGDVINWSSERNPTDLPWADLNVDLVCECTGVFTSREKAAMHIDWLARKKSLSRHRVAMLTQLSFMASMTIFWMVLKKLFQTPPAPLTAWHPWFSLCRKASVFSAAI